MENIETKMMESYFARKYQEENDKSMLGMISNMNKEREERLEREHKEWKKAQIEAERSRMAETKAPKNMYLRF